MRFRIPAMLGMMIVVPLVLTGLAAIGGVVVMLLWNWLLPPLFGTPEVTFFQALGLLVLCRLLFGGAGGHVRRRSYWTAEEKARFRMRMRRRLGFSGPGVETPADAAQG